MNQVREHEWDDDVTVITSNLTTDLRGWDETTAAATCMMNEGISSDEGTIWNDNGPTEGHDMAVPGGNVSTNKTREKWNAKSLTGRI